MSAQAKIGDTVSVHYTGRLGDGQVFDSSVGSEPLEFAIGAGELIPGFENGIVGMSVGDKKTINIAADDAYGQRIEALVQAVPRDSLKLEVEPEVGMGFYLQMPNGQQMPVAVTEVTDETLTLDANHPLAGHDLTFDIEVVSLQHATE
jgi:peptidylprolyl isomerase